MKNRTVFPATFLVAHPWSGIVALGALLLLQGCWRTSAQEGVALQITFALLTVLALGAIHLRRRESRTKGGDPSEGPVWIILEWALSLKALAQCARAIVVLNWAPVRLGEAMQFIQLAAGLLCVVALLMWPSSRIKPSARLRFGLDGFLFAISTFFILWAIFLGGLFRTADVPLHLKAFYLVFFLLSNLQLGLTVYLGSQAPRRYLGPMGWLALAFLLATLANLTWGIHTLFEPAARLSHPLGIATLGIPICYFLAARNPHPLGADGDGPTAGFWSHAAVALPYLPFCGALAVGMLRLAHGTSLDDHILLWMGFVLVLALLWRQQLALQDLKLWSRELEARVQDRTQALEAAQSAMLKTERMNTVATLGAGLTHDLNNLLAIIQASTEMVEAQSGELSQERSFNRIRDATGRALDLTRRIMAFSREPADAGCAEPLDFAAAVVSLQDILRLLLPHTIELRLELEPGAYIVSMDRDHLEQVLVNLVSNARDAIQGQGRVTLRLKAGTTAAGLPAALLDVEDTGSGMAPEVMRRIFEPFFTTKGEGRGTGLGLASVRALMDASGGSVEVQSLLGKGTTFRLRMPLLS